MYKVKNNSPSADKDVENSSPEAVKSQSPKQEEKPMEDKYYEEYGAEYDAEEPVEESEDLRRKNSDEENSELLR